MLYCTKCNSVCEDSKEKCPSCKSAKLRSVSDSDMVLLHRADEYTATRLCNQFDDLGIVYELKPFAKNSSAYMYDSEVMPTDKKIFVRYCDLPAAKELSSQLKQQLESEQNGEDEEFEDMPKTKRLIVQSLSIVAFMLLVMLAVFGADALAGWLKGLLGM